MLEERRLCHESSPSPMMASEGGTWNVEMWKRRVETESRRTGFSNSIMYVEGTTITQKRRLQKARGPGDSKV